MPRMSVNFGPRMSVNFGSPQKSPKASLDGDPGERGPASHITFKDQISVRACVAGRGPAGAVLHPAHPAPVRRRVRHRSATAGAYVVDGVEPVALPLTHRFSGLYEITLGAGKCDAYAPMDDTYTDADHYAAKLALVQEDGTTLEAASLKLHDKGAAVSPTRRARALLSGGGASGPTGADVYETFYFTVDPSGAGSNLVVEVSSDCPRRWGSPSRRSPSARWA